MPLPEIEFLATVFELQVQVDEHIFYFTSKEIPREEEIKEFFGLDHY